MGHALCSWRFSKRSKRPASLSGRAMNLGLARRPNPRLQRTRAARSPLSRKPFGAPRIAGVVSVVLLMGCSAGPSLEPRIRDLVGPTAIDCGHVQLNGDRSASGHCLRIAFGSGRPFWVRYDHRGVDSHIETAILRTPAGSFVRLEYDSDIRGGGFFWAKPSLTESLCTGRLVETEGKPPEVGCE